MAQNYTFNYANLNPVSGWSANSITAPLTDTTAAANDAAAKTAAASVLGHTNKNTPADVQAHLEKKQGAEQGKFDKQKSKVDSHKHAVDALNTALAAATDPKVKEELQKELDKENKKLGQEDTKLTAQQTHITALQDRITKVGETTAGGAAVQGQSNYFSDLIDKTIGSRAGISGWHPSFGTAATAANPAAVIIGANGLPVAPAPGTAPVVGNVANGTILNGVKGNSGRVDPVTGIFTPSSPGGATTGDGPNNPLGPSVPNPFMLNAQKRIDKINAKAAKRAVLPVNPATFNWQTNSPGTVSGWV